MRFEAIASGQYLEGLAIDGDVAWYSDVVGGGLHRRTADGRLTTWFADKQFIAALALNEDGRVLYSGAHGVAWLDPASGASGVLVDTIDGVAIPGVNEMTPDGEGGLYFGIIDLISIAKGERPKPSSLCRLYQDGRLVRLVDGLKFSNGLGLSPDRTRLYHNESFVGTFAYDIAADGALGPATMLLNKPDCDGLAVDGEGGVWVSGFRSSDLTRIAPGGATETLALPGEAATNIRFGGADGRTLYVNTATLASVDALERGAPLATASSALHRAASPVAGLRIERPRFELDAAD